MNATDIRFATGRSSLWRAWAHLSVVLFAVILIGCNRYEATPQCSAVIKEGFTGYFKVSSNGLAVDQITGQTWYRCNAGQRYQNGQCVGQALHLSQPEAMAYAEEFSKASGRKWRLPTQGEMATINLSECVNPSVNPNVFPNMLVSNYWSSEGSGSNSRMGCANSTCKTNMDSLIILIFFLDFFF
ncbi:MAG: DUF1566 domain-containing protein [Burkholderiaceae bacterium]|nr:DUF1566 domain-containing protein [Burkholderiaceae bacterium]